MLFALLADLFVPWGIATAPAGRTWRSGLVAIGGQGRRPRCRACRFEVTVAKLRLFRVPELMAGAFVLSILAVLSALVVP